MGGAQGQGQISNMMFMQIVLLRVRIKHQHKMCQFLFNHKSGEEGGTDFLAITPFFALTVLLRAEIKAGKTFAAFCLPQSRAGGPKTGGTGTDGQMGAKPAHFQSGWRSRAVSNSRSNFTDFLNLRNRNIC